MNIRIKYLAIIYFCFVVIFLSEALVTPHLNYWLPFVGYGGTFRYSSIHIGDISISLYWFSYIVGIIGMVVMCLYRANAYQVKKCSAVLTAVLLAVFGYIGAKILYTLENIEYVMKNGNSLGGVSFYGTVFFMPLVIPLMALAMKKKPSSFLDYCTPAGIVMLTCIRTGCFMKGCCHGLTFWINNRPVTIPSQLIECTLDIILLDIIFRLERNDKYKGKLYLFFMGGYGFLRFFVEFVRDTPKDVLHLSHAQWFSVLSMFICCMGRIVSTHISKTKP